MQRGMKESFRRTLDLLKENKSAIFTIGAVLFIFMMGMNMITQVAMFIVYGLMALAGGAIAGGIYLVNLGGDMMVIGVILLILGSLVLLAMILALIGLVVIINSIGFGAQIYLAELLLRLKRGIKPEWKGIVDEAKREWKHLLKRGFKLFIRYLLLALILIILVDIVGFGTIAAVVFLAATEGTSGAVVSLVLFVAILLNVVLALMIIIILPIFMFIADASCVRMAEGKDAGTAIRHGLKDVRYNSTGIFYYFVGILILSLLSMVVFPVAVLLQPLLPILTKSFILMNRDMFYD
ncbi:MAG: DUF4013 domain-containing protein [Thermoplasmatota archaeon]